MRMICFFLILGFTSWSLAQDHHEEHQQHAHHEQVPATESGPLMAGLSPTLQDLLRQEMLLLEQGMANLAKHLPKGEWESVAQISAQMRNSYILKKKLTADHKKELGKLPAEFLALDQAFHQTAEKLEHAAHERDAELSVFYLSRMMDRCIGCHAQYAGPRFPGLVQSTASHEH